MAAAVRNGYTDIRSIKAAYANFQNQRQQTGNRYDEGGDVDNNDVEVVNVLDEHPVWKALGNIDYETVADPELTVINQNAYGGNLFKTGGNKNKKSATTSNQIHTMNYITQELMNRGVPKDDALAVAANIMVESSGNPGAVNPTSGAKGLVQLLGSRKKKVKSWSMEGQLDHIAASYNKLGGDEWLNKDAWRRFNESKDPAEKARLFRRYWERPEKSSWYATDKYFGKQSYLPQEVNDLVAQVSNLQFDEPKAPVFTEEDQRLLDTPALAIVNPEYEDTQAPDYKPSALQESIKLDESLWRNPANGWSLYNQFANMQQGSSQDDPLGWMTTMASLSPKTTPEQKEAASTMYQLFAPQDGDYSYHGLNFAAYGGKVNRFGLGGDEQSVLPEVEVTGTVPKVSFTGCVPAARHALAEHLGISDQGVGALYNLYGNAWDIANSAYMTSLPFSQQSAQPGDLVVMSRPSLQSDEKRGIPTSNQHVGLII